MNRQTKIYYYTG